MSSSSPVLTESANYTHVYWMRWRESNTGWRTLLRHVTDHCAVVKSGGTELGVYSNRNGGFFGSGSHIKPGKFQVLTVTGQTDASKSPPAKMWDFENGQNSNVFRANPWTWPSTFTVELWISKQEQGGYLFSWERSNKGNAILFPADNVLAESSSTLFHMVLTWDGTSFAASVKPVRRDDEPAPAAQTFDAPPPPNLSLLTSSGIKTARR